ncbi:formate dehydrogenase subunit gamma [Amorphus sp. 3PC139-8]|uniref:formate dehydrogenase subunit gamma n=1 Tax=Amorphus sp. 3PC139-8 TaxID=2735676 RepID=UPI00345CDBA9
MSGSSDGRDRSKSEATSVLDIAERASDYATLCEAHGNRPDALIEILHAVQARFGYVPDDAAATLAHALNLSRAEVHGVITFYHDFHTAPVGRHVVRLCRAEACQAVGAHALVRHACASYEVEPGQTTADGSITLEEVFCLGNCALGPAAEIDGRLYGRMTADRLNRITADLRSTTSEAAE